MKPVARRSCPLGVALLALAGLPMLGDARGHEPQAASEVVAPAPGTVACKPGRCTVGLAGRQLTRDGRPWIPKGVVITGHIAPEGYIRGVYAKAREAWGPRLLRQLQDAGVDTLRFNLSLAGLDPKNAMPDGAMTPARKAQYLAQIVAAVDLAEQYGMNSLVTLTNGQPSGDPDSEGAPGEQAGRAWSVLAPALAGRTSVFLNAFNEPGFRGAERVDEDPSPWQRWRAGYQPMVDVIRQAGSRQVIVLNGIGASKVWRGNTDANVPKDPLGMLAYDVHPFPTDSGQRRKGGSRKLDFYRSADIDHWLGGWCDRHACIASAFFTGVSNNAEKGKCYDGQKGLDGAPRTPDLAREFIDYFLQRRIGVLVFAGDWPNRMFDRPGHPGARLTSFEGFTQCRDSARATGPGEMLRESWSRLHRGTDEAPR